MPRVSVWISKNDLAIIDQFCKEKKRSRSEVLYRSAVHIIEKYSPNDFVELKIPKMEYTQLQQLLKRYIP